MAGRYVRHPNLLYSVQFILVTYEMRFATDSADHIYFVEGDYITGDSRENEKSTLYAG